MPKNISTNYENPKFYAVKHKNEEIRAASRSGGVFTVLSDEILKDGGVVYGCVLVDCVDAKYIRADNQVDRNKMRWSKYIQSDLQDTFMKVRTDLLANRSVLFSGTSCQIAGLKAYLGQDYDTLLCVDIVCHGVPSPKVWKEYLKWQEKRKHKKIVAADFRDKVKYGCKKYIETLYFEDDSSVSSDIFKNLFYGHTILRPCCYQCPYKSIQHPGNITIADYWGIEKAAPGFSDNKGGSLVLINNEHGKELFEKVKNGLICEKTRMEDSMQTSFKKPFPKPSNREQFWNDFHHKKFRAVAVKYGNFGVANSVKASIKKLLEK